MYAPGSTTLSIERSSSMQFEHYVIESRQRLYRFAVVLCGDPVLASDLITDVLGRAFERWHQVSAARDPHAYVRRMVVNEFVSWQRRRARTVPYAEVGQLADLRAGRLGSSGPNLADASCRNSPPANAPPSCCATTKISATRTSPRRWAAASARYEAASRAGWLPCASPVVLRTTGRRHDP
jgi:hypothetical protein